MKNIVRTLVLSLSIVALVPNQAQAFNGGLLSADTTLLRSGSPYTIVESIQVPQGVTLTIEAGVEIFSNTGKPLFYINGTVRILGSSENPVRISSKGAVFFLKGAREAVIEVRNATIDGQGTGALVPSTGYEQNAHYTFTDSDFTNFGGYSYIWYPLSFVAERNVFYATPGFSIGFSGSPAPIFRNNLFLGAPRSNYGKQYWIEAWASYDSTLEVLGNTFAGGPYTAVTTTGTYDKVPLNATRNYWGSLDSAFISSMVKDKSDGLDFGTVIDTSSPLALPDSTTPVSTRYKILSKPIAAKKYKNCSALNKDYDGGVARTATSRNKGSALKKLFIVNSRVYDLNKSLDRDKDGLVCER